MGIVVRRGREKDSRKFIGLVLELAKFERLRPPSLAGRERILEDVFRKKRLGLFVAADGEDIVGYALYYYGYSSFMARPTLYLEDLFVSERRRGKRVGLELLRKCAREAVKHGCGRMEWAVLKWNSKAIDFYDGLGAKRLDEWAYFRLDERGLGRVAKGTA